MPRDLTATSCGRGLCRIRSGHRTRVNGTGKFFPRRANCLQWKNKERKLNTKKCLITIVSGMLITAVTHAQEASEDLTAEQHQLAQRKAELDAREKALDRREKKLAEKEKATASPALQSREKGKAKAKHQQTIAQSEEEQAKAAVAGKKLHEPFWKRLDDAFLEQLGTPAYIPGTPPPVRRIPPPPFDSPPFPNADWQIGGTAGTAII